MKFLYDKADGTVGLVYVPDGGQTPARIVGRDATTHAPVHARWSVVKSAWVQVKDAPEPLVMWDVWEGGRPHAQGFLSKAAAVKTAAQYNAEEEGNAAMERRAVKRNFFVVKATTTYEVED